MVLRNFKTLVNIFYAIFFKGKHSQQMILATKRGYLLKDRIKAVFELHLCIYSQFKVLPWLFLYLPLRITRNGVQALKHWRK